MSVMEACFAESGDPDEVAALRAECARLRARDGELRTACGRLERRVNRLVEEQDWATRRIARLTDRCTQLAGLVPVVDEETSADDASTVDGGAVSGGAAAGGLVAALAGDGGARLAAAIQTAVGDLAALSVPDPDTGVELGCLADLPDRTVADLAAASCRLATWAKLAATVAAEELVTRWENGAADEEASPVNAQPVFPDHDLGFRAAIAETATTCVISESTLTARVDTLRDLPARLPGLWHLLATGAVDIDTARLVHSKTRHLPGEVLTRLEPQILVKVTALTWGQLAAWLDRIVAKADPRELAEQIADNLERRNVSFRTAAPGTGRMTLTASVEAIEAIRMALLGYASAGDDPDHHRRAAAIRADIITDLITRPGTHTAAPQPAPPLAQELALAPTLLPTSAPTRVLLLPQLPAPTLDACLKPDLKLGLGQGLATTQPLTPPPQLLRQPQAPTPTPAPAPARHRHRACPCPWCWCWRIADRTGHPARPMPITRTRAAPVPTSICPPTPTRPSPQPTPEPIKPSRPIATPRTRTNPTPRAKAIPEPKPNPHPKPTPKPIPTPALRTTRADRTRPPPVAPACRPHLSTPRPSRRCPAPGSTSPSPCPPSSAARASERSTTTDPSPPKPSANYSPGCTAWAPPRPGDA
ncbi:MAG: DUF222 domain-containing protein [Kineosporiaceae bacterium]